MMIKEMAMADEADSPEMTLARMQEIVATRKPTLREFIEEDLKNHDATQTYRYIGHAGTAKFLYELVPDRFDPKRGWTLTKTNLGTGATEVHPILGSATADHVGLVLELRTRGWRRIPMNRDPADEREKVYLIGCDETDLVKIGYSGNVDRRLREIQCMSPVTLRVLWTDRGSRAVEAALHTVFAGSRRQGEWFALGGHKDAIIKVETALRGLVP